MVEARQREAWDHTATLLAMQANTAFGKKRAAKTPLDFHPYRRRQATRRLTRQASRERLHTMAGIKRKGEGGRGKGEGT